MYRNLKYDFVLRLQKLLRREQLELGRVRPELQFIVRE
jgi:hypothetical protein